MWNSTIMYAMAKDRQAEFEHEAKQAHMARIARGSDSSRPAISRAAGFLRRIVAHTEQRVVVRGFAEPAARTVPECEQPAC